LFPVSIIEGPIVTVIAGFLVSLHQINLGIAYVVLVMGDVVGDSALYFFGFYGGHRFIKRWGHLIRVTDEDVDKLGDHFGSHSGKTLIIGKLTHSLGSVVLFSAGMAKMPFWKFIWYNLVSTLPKTLVLLIVGYYFGEAYPQIKTYFDYITLAGLLIVVLAVVFYLFFKRSKK
jgi:membrane protein DedA with SNARE-associated domain